MAYGDLAATGLTRYCYDLCPDMAFAARAVEAVVAGADVELASTAGISETGRALLESRLNRTLEPVSAAAAQCQGGPWTHGGSLVCGRSTGIIELDLGKRGKGVVRTQRDPQD